MPDKLLLLCGRRNPGGRRLPPAAACFGAFARRCEAWVAEVAGWPKADPSAPKVDLSVPKADLSVPKADLSAPKADLSAPQPAPESA